MCGSSSRWNVWAAVWAWWHLVVRGSGRRASCAWGEQCCERSPLLQEEASLLQQRDLTLRSALDQIQQRRRHPRHSPPPPPRPLATKEEEGERRAAVPTPAPHPQGGGGPLEALRQREWLLNLQEQQELQRLRAPATPPRQKRPAVAGRVSSAPPPSAFTGAAHPDKAEVPPFSVPPLGPT
ncbi:hypothetical protein HPB48_017439 [Haemaphysalis longicornis]|uniref:Uncharacterized protein n=1 Tax=Haemaphysalis longicornis TaxID=44386 RepID=A0A9J6FN43_HAELO|nr:hypothetical protein HPB48_017439 [Haemaphysalis longicornis]